MRAFNKTLFLMALASLIAAIQSCGETNAAGEDALFTKFTYTGQDLFYNGNELAEGEFYNPVLQGFYPDPSITRKGEDYYLVNSTFSYFPGVPVFHSKDLVNWEQIGNVLSRPSQLPLDGLRMSQGIYAPAIEYNEHNDTFYMITTLVGGPNGGNFIVKVKDPAGEWSDPIYLPEIGGIDPSLFFDDDGKGYIVHNDVPDGEQLYEGHRAIRLWEFDPQTDKVTGGGKVMVNGGVNIKDKPIWIEGPHIYKKGGYYYIMCAEGGTSVWHSEVIFRSERVDGPYVPAESNPILTQRHLTSQRDYEVTSAGHADIVSTPEGGHYIVFLACRPYEGNMYNTGRETFLLPVDWSGEYPVVIGGTEPVRLKQNLPSGVENKTGAGKFMPNGNFTFADDFKSEKLGMRWLMIRTPDGESVMTGQHGLRLKKRPVSIRESGHPSFAGYRQQHLAFTAETSMKFEPAAQSDMAGMVCFQNDGFNYVFGVTLSNEGKKVIVLEKTVGKEKQTVASAELPAKYGNIDLRIKGDSAKYSFYYSVDSGGFKSLAENQDGTILSTHVAQGFTGCVIGLYASSKND